MKDFSTKEKMIIGVHNMNTDTHTLDTTELSWKFTYQFRAFKFINIKLQLKLDQDSTYCIIYRLSVNVNWHLMTTWIFKF